MDILFVIWAAQQARTTLDYPVFGLLPVSQNQPCRPEGKKKKKKKPRAEKK